MFIYIFLNSFCILLKKPYIPYTGLLVEPKSLHQNLHQPYIAYTVSVLFCFFWFVLIKNIKKNNKKPAQKHLNR